MRRVLGRRRGRQGFTLVETSIVVAVAAIVTTIGMNFMMDMQAKSRRRASVPGLVAALERARAESAARIDPVYFIVRDVGGRVYWQSFVDIDADFDPTTLNVAQTTDVLLDEGVLLESATLEANGSADPLAAPLHQVPAEVACSFCDGFEDAGVIRFGTDGTARLGVDFRSRPFGGSFSIRVEDIPVAYETIAVLSSTGLVRRVTR